MSELISLASFLSSKFRRHASLLRAAFSICILSVLFPVPSHAGPVMALNGTPVVDSKGQFNYTIPIAVPPGTAGMVPHLALTYSSSNGDGYEGIGWTISGLDKVTRCPQPSNFWSSRGGVNNDGNDGFCFNGSPVLPVNNSLLYGTAPTYDTAMASYFRMVAHTTGGITGPSWFEVRLKNGTTIELGNTTDSKVLTASGSSVVREWLVDKITDIHGNYLKVTYTPETSSSQAYPTEIDYTGNGGHNPYNSVQFVYSPTARVPTRVDVVPTYQGGAATTVTKLLSDIITNNGTSAGTPTPVLDYRLTYRNGTTTLHSRLASIQLCDGTGSNCLPATTFGWQAGTGLGTVSSTSEPVTPAFTGDFDGDGLLDIAVSGCPSGGAIYLGATGFGSAGMTLALPPSYVPGPACFNSLTSVATGDIEGDGLTDFLGNDTSSELVPVGNGGPTATTTFTGYAPTTPQADAVADFSGDGLVDYLETTHGTVFEGVGNGIFPNYDTSPFGGLSGVTLGDFNGDGCIDVMSGSVLYFYYKCQPNAGSIGFSNCTSGTKITGDFNGDGNTDVVSVPSSGSATLCLSNGRTLATSLTISSSTSWSGYRIVAGDFNGDGKTDLALISPSGGTDMIALSTGSDFVTTSFTGVAAASVRAADFNSDGADDVWLTNGSTNTLISFAFKPELMNVVTNGVGMTVSINYDKLNNTAFYTKGPGGYTGGTFKLFDITGAYYAVSQVAYSNGTGGAYTNYNLSYTYFGAIGFVSDAPVPAPKWNILTSKFETFTHITSVDSRSGLTTTSTYRTPLQVIGMLTSVVTTAPGGVIVSEQDTTYEGTWDRDASGLVYVSATSDTRSDLDGSTISIHKWQIPDDDVDDYGNPLQTIETFGFGSSAVTRTTVNTVGNDKTNWLLNEISESDVEAASSTSDIQRHTGFGIDSATGFVKSMTTEPGNAALSLETDYHYDGFGNKYQTTQYSLDTPVSVPSRTNEVDYDTPGEFPVQNKDAGTHVSTATFDPRFGLVTSTDDPNGVGPTTDYDTLGRVADIVSADLTTKTFYTYAYCGGAVVCPSTGVYVVTVTPKNKLTLLQNGAITSTYYDAFDRVIAADTQGLNGDTVRTSSIYDSNGLLSQTSRPYFLVGGTPQWTTYAHDALSRVTQITYPDSSQTTYCYHGKTTATTNALGYTKTVVVDDQGNVTSVTDGQGGTVTSNCTAGGTATTSFTYDAFNNVLTVSDANTNTVITNIYDKLGRKTDSTDLDMGHWTYSYDQLGELTGQTDAKSQSTVLTYDKLQRPLTRTEAGPIYSKWLYDQPNGIGKLMNACTPLVTTPTTCINGNSQQKPGYDTLSRIANGRLTLDGSTYTYTTSYDGDGHLATLLYPSGFQADYVYNQYGYLTKIKDDASGNIIWQATQDDAEGHITQQAAGPMGSRVTTTSVYDPQTGRVLSICADTSAGSCAGGVADLSYTWDTIGNLTSRADTMYGWTEQFCYDKFNRLMNSSFGALCTTAGTYSKSMSYDMIGNLKKKSDVCNTAGCYVYGGAAPHQLTSISGTFGGVSSPNFAYDANGNMTCEYTGTSCTHAATVRAVTYTPFNMAATVATGGTTAGFDYRADRMRYKMCVPDCSGTPTSTRLYLYDPATGGMSEKLVSGGSTTWTDYVLSPEGHIVATRTKGSGAATWSYTVVDNLGSTVSMSSTGGIERDSYDAWGKRRDPSNGADVSCGSITSQTTRGFTGHEMIDNQCLINMNARLYDPVIGKFQSADSVVPDAANTQSYNRYSYVENNPLSATDPTGHMVCWTYKQEEHCAQEPGGGPPCWGCTGNGWDNNGDGSDGLGNVTFKAQTTNDGLTSSMTITRAGSHMWITTILRASSQSDLARLVVVTGSQGPEEAAVRKLRPGETAAVATVDVQHPFTGPDAEKNALAALGTNVDNAAIATGRWPENGGFVAGKDGVFYDTFVATSNSPDGLFWTDKSIDALFRDYAVYDYVHSHPSRNEGWAFSDYADKPNSRSWAKRSPTFRGFYLDYEGKFSRYPLPTGGATRSCGTDPAGLFGC